MTDIYTKSSMTVNKHKETQDQHHERSTTGRYHIAQAVHGNTRKHIRRLACKTKGLKIDSEYVSHLRFADDIFICVNIPHDYNKCCRN